MSNNEKQPKNNRVCWCFVLIQKLIDQFFDSTNIAQIRTLWMTCDEQLLWKILLDILFVANKISFKSKSMTHRSICIAYASGIFLSHQRCFCPGIIFTSEADVFWASRPNFSCNQFEIHLLVNYFWVFFRSQCFQKLNVRNFVSSHYE